MVKDLSEMMNLIMGQERRIAALEAEMHSLKKKMDKWRYSCPECGAPAQRILVGAPTDPNLAESGVLVETIQCENGHTKEVKWSP